MAEADDIKITSPAADAMSELGDRLAIAVATKADERAAARERMHRRHLKGAAEVFAGVRGTRRRLDPRRLVDRAHERACRRLLTTMTGPDGGRDA